MLGSSAEHTSPATLTNGRPMLSSALRRLSKAHAIPWPRRLRRVRSAPARFRPCCWGIPGPATNARRHRM
eukprot:10803899-Heterocapsa_arctica.AAC.1